MFRKDFLEFLKGEEGATAIEYALIAVFVGGALAASMPYLKTVLSNLFLKLANSLANNT